MSTKIQRIASSAKQKKNKCLSDDGHATALTVAQRNHDLRNRMRQSRTYGSVGARGEQSPRATRPQLRKPKAELVKRCVLPQPAYTLFTPWVLVL